MIKTFVFLGLLVTASSYNLFGQTGTPIQLDRPDQTECSFIVPLNYLQIENGFTIENSNSDLKTYSYPSTLWKYGLNDKFEVRLITEFVSEIEKNKSNSGLIPITIGFKTKLCQEKGIIPLTSFIGHITTSKIGSKEFYAAYIAPSFRFAMQHTLSGRFSLAYNLGIEWNGETAVQTYIYTLTTGVTLTEKLGGYLEIYGFAPYNSQADHRFDTGLTFLLKNDLMLDISGGLGLTENAPENYLSLGLSYRFKTTKK